MTRSEKGSGAPAAWPVHVPGLERGLGLIFAMLATAVWALAGASAQSGAGVGELALFCRLTLGFLVLLTLSWRARTSESFTGRWQWWVVAAVVVARLSSAVAEALGAGLVASSANVLWLASSAWLVTSAPSGRRISLLLVLEAAMSLLFGLLAWWLGGWTGLALLALMAAARMFASINRERGRLYLAILVLPCVDLLLASLSTTGMLAGQPGWQAMREALPMLALVWALAIGIPRPVRSWWALPHAARLLCRRIPTLMALAVTSGGLMLWHASHVLAIAGLLVALALAAAQRGVRRRQERQRGAGGQAIIDPSHPRARVLKHLYRVLGEQGHSDSTCTVLVLDLDRFAAFNRRYGQASGDVVLARVESTLRANLMRAGDQVARWGGDRFLIVLPGTSANVAPVVARRLLHAVQALGIGHAATPSGVVTASIGAATRPHWRRQGARQLMRDADAAMQRAKGDGRNRWESDLLPFDGVHGGPLATSVFSCSVGAR